MSEFQIDPTPTHLALARLLETLKRCDYAFVTPTPATQERVLARSPQQTGRSLRDVLGWSMPFQAGAISSEIQELLRLAGVLENDGDLWKSCVRVSSLGDDLFLHSAFPTLDANAVFFGPDSYRFAELIRRELGGASDGASLHIVDVGTGAGVGAIVAGRLRPGARVTMTDINADALAFASVNAAHAGQDIAPICCAGLTRVEGPIDVVTINPPYLIDRAGRAYRDGGKMHGGQLTMELCRDALARVRRGGQVICYSGSAIVDGTDNLHVTLNEAASAAGATLHYYEIDPDVFGEELLEPAYATVERISLVAAIFFKA